MSPTPVIEQQVEAENSTATAPQPDVEEQSHDPNPEQEQNWLTIRRRCELCKQRKVRDHAVFIYLYLNILEIKQRDALLCSHSLAAS